MSHKAVNTEEMYGKNMSTFRINAISLFVTKNLPPGVKLINISTEGINLKIFISVCIFCIIYKYSYC